MSANSTAAGARSVAIHRLTSSTRSAKRPLAVSVTPSPRTFRTEAPAATVPPADLRGLEGVIHSLLLRALEKIVDRMHRASQQSDDPSRRPPPISKTDSSTDSSLLPPADPCAPTLPT